MITCINLRKTYLSFQKYQLPTTYGTAEAGAGADKYLSGTFHASGDNFRAHDDIKKFVYDKGKGHGDKDCNNSIGRR